MKSLLQSKTFWVAVLQAVFGVLIVVATEMDALGYVAVLKSLLDISLRMVTYEAID